MEEKLTPNGLEVLKRRYVRRDEEGCPAEGVDEVFWRVAHYVAAVEAQWGEDVDRVAEQFHELIGDLRFMPNSPTFTGAGTPLGQLAACFVLPISDDMGRKRDGIFQTLRDMALIQQTGGGTGFSFSRLRPKGAIVRSSGGQATGPVGFMRVFDTASDIVSQGGARRGANMAVLRVDHPDIEEFVTCKREEQTITNFNLSVGMTDSFMQAVEDGGSIDLVNPQDGEVWCTEDAGRIFDQIVAGAHRNGEPGILFLDAANRDNPCPHLGEYEATNPCVVGDTWVTTDQGPLQVSRLLGRQVRLLSNGTFYPTTAEGFFYTGEREVLEIRTRKGYRISVTPDHPMRRVTRMTGHVTQSDWTAAGELKPGDRLVLGDNRGSCWQGHGTEDEGYLLGLLVSDGTLTAGPNGRGKAVLSVWGDTPGVPAARSKGEPFAGALDQRIDFDGFTALAERQAPRLVLRSVYDLAPEYGLSRDFKGISPEIEATGSDFHAGFLRGLFDGEGTVIDSETKGVSVRLNRSGLSLLEAAQRMLHRLGVVSTIIDHELLISGADLEVFATRIGFTDTNRMRRLTGLLDAYVRELDRERFVDDIVAIEPKGSAPVYDAHVPGEHAFDANGFWVHNCGEQYLLPYENCCLGSINLAQHVQVGDNGRPHIDWHKLGETTGQAVRFLDDVIDANRYVPDVPQLEEAAHRTRRIGLGIMGLGDLMYHLGVRYGSVTAQELAGQVMEFVRYHAMRASVRLAQERGPFPAIAGSVFDPHDFTWSPPRPFKPYTRPERWGRPALDWVGLAEDIRRHGIRNAAQTTIAPTGTTATVAGLEAYGCEPVFALAYVRHVNDNGKDVELAYTSPLFLHALERAGLGANEREAIVEQVRATGSCQAVAAVPPALRDVFVVAGDISAEEHVHMQAALQAFVDASISKTINFPTTATPDDVAHAFQLAWQLGCKGITVYVTGSREQVVLETEETRREKQDRKEGTSTLSRRPRPHVLKGSTYRLGTPLGTAYITINHNGDDEPFEVFLNVGKAGSDTAAVAEAIGRLISLVLRIPSPLSTGRRMKHVVDQLKGIGGGRPLGFGRDRIRSLPDGVAQVLGEHLGLLEPGNGKQDVKQLNLFPTGDLCPECGQASLVNEEGCRHCYSCGYSEC
jgi:ribonucleoside-diphosphate reductase alpha chain